VGCVAVLAALSALASARASRQFAGSDHRDVAAPTQTASSSESSIRVAGVTCSVLTLRFVNLSAGRPLGFC
jgi:hypothetical protein